MRLVACDTATAKLLELLNANLFRRALRQFANVDVVHPA